ncbi:heparinase II/III domain-containing protein [Microvirga thermotolerans]|uniref:Heparinase n=1 Tax=Microvirga thermotolerans TaxID=2651334 RepID=A0A5P9JXQ9_9HYPH|nr:heparinase II/III family protein [Microvirga thermotolerans]QFU17642.1 heparinase [Microvirga thermotolerans]
MLGVRQILPASVQHAGDSEAGSHEGTHLIATKNRWSRVVLIFPNLTPDVWCQFSFEIACETDDAARQEPDYATVGIDFQAGDGSSIDFASVPGLVRGQIDPFQFPVGGPGLCDGHSSQSHTRKVRIAFLVPAPATQAQVTIRSWRNTKPFVVGNLSLVQFVQGNTEPNPAGDELAASVAERNASPDARRNWPILSTSPRWFQFGLVPRHNLFVRGQLVAESTSSEGTLVRVVYRDEQGHEIPPPYADLPSAPGIGAFISIPTRSRARRFTLELTAPENAGTVELGFCTTGDTSRIELVLPLEVSLGYDLLLENIEEDAAKGPGDFLSATIRRLAGATADTQAVHVSRLVNHWVAASTLASPSRILGRLRSLHQREQDRVSSGRLHIEGFPDWELPLLPTWDEDPFHSPAWRMRYHSLIWLLDFESSDRTEALKRSIELALSWSRANSWSEPSDELRFHPSLVAQRLEVLIDLLSRQVETDWKLSSEQLHGLLGEAIRHGIALAEIIGQNAIPPSVSYLHAAVSLLAAAQALSRIPLATYWEGLALHKLREGFDELMGPNGDFHIQSLHERLELVSLGTILRTTLNASPGVTSLNEHLAPRLKEAMRRLIALTDPGGVLPPFGETPFTLRHASWIRKLLSSYGRDLMRDKDIRAELSYPQGTRIFAAPDSDLIAARFYEQGRTWGYFCATLSKQCPFAGHSDTTSFVFASGSRRWIVDSSGSTLGHVGDARRYLTSPRAHNVAIPNGRIPSAGTAWLKSHFSIAGVHIYEVCSNVHGPSLVHRRIFALSETLGSLAVIDHFSSEEEPVSFEAFLHFDPETVVSIASEQLAVGFQSKQKLRIQPLAISGQPDGLEVVRGRRSPPSLQGFISRNSGQLLAASVLRYGFFGQRNVCGGVLMALDEVSYRSILEAVRSPDFLDRLHLSSLT